MPHQLDAALADTQPIPALGLEARILARLQAAADWLLELIYPPVCFGCQRPDTSICELCRQELLAAPLNVQSNNGARGYQALTTGRHAGILRRAVQAFKYEGITELDELLGARLLAALAIDDRQFDCIMPVPLHKRRLRERGYNQAELLCRLLERQLRIECRTDLLIRNRDTKQQAQLSKEERKTNVNGAFDVIGEVRGRRILLVDDVLTTGETISECVKELRAKGAAEVLCLAVTRRSGSTNQTGGL